MTRPETLPFVLHVQSIAGQSVEETCHAAVQLAQRLGCLISTEINDIPITVGGAMTEKDAYESWLFYSKKREKTETSLRGL
jgi:hypothetical protein